MLTVWMLDPNDCGLLTGWPKTVENWSTHDDYKKAVSIGVAVDVDEAGNIIVAGNFWVGNKPQGYVVLLNWAGSRLWEKAGQPGAAMAGLACARSWRPTRAHPAAPPDRRRSPRGCRAAWTTAPRP